MLPATDAISNNLNTLTLIVGILSLLVVSITAVQIAYALTTERRIKHLVRANTNNAISPLKQQIEHNRMAALLAQSLGYMANNRIDLALHPFSLYIKTLAALSPNTANEFCHIIYSIIQQYDLTNLTIAKEYKTELLNNIPQKTETGFIVFRRFIQQIKTTE